ncbi:MAG: amino acid decarboxylase [Acidobacteria bacterium]|nr:amino acid decarboxylase [Acidobacteriota bacterium]MCA1609791.1 amino acid decarboxylase [Acidobacteriota bacterium]
MPTRNSAMDDPGDRTRTPMAAAPALGDLPSDVLRAELHRMADWAARYRESIEERLISPAVAPGEIRSALGASPPEEPEPLERIVADLDRVVMPGIVHWGHPAFLGYFGSTSNGPALLGEIAAAALNVSAMTWKTSPAATELETVVLEWIRQMVGLPAPFQGVVYDTASVAVVHALAVARERAGASVRQRGVAGRGDLPVCRVYASDQAHSSLEKAMILLGLGESNAVRVVTDAAFRMDAGALRSAIDADLREGMKPLAVVATAGTTSTASIDPVSEIAAVCRLHGAWLHVDAAYGGALGLLPERRGALAGIELADSVVVNPHKWLFVPLDFSALYMRRPEALRALFSLVPEYLRGDSDSGSIDYMDYGIQLGRRFRALKAWMVFRAFGRSGLAARIREQCRLAEWLAAQVETEPEFALCAPVTMAVVCFRYEPPGTEESARDGMNEAIVAAVNATGRAYLTHTRLRGRVVLRVGIGNLQTTEEHVARAWDLVRTAAADVRIEPAVRTPERGPRARDA